MLDRAREIVHNAGLDPGERAVDVGGGYGDHAAQWVSLGMHSLVIDPSSAMRSHAVCQPGVHVIAGRGEHLPLIDGSVGLIYMHLSIHYCDAAQALDESLRVLRVGGSIAIGTLGRRHHESSFLARWFPSIAHSDAARFPDPVWLAAHLAERGASDVRIEEVDISSVSSAGAWRSAVLAGFVSSLQFVPPAELSDGLAAFGRAFPDRDSPVTSTMRYDWVWGRR